MTALAAARRELQRAADDLEALQLRMQGILATLPEPAAEAFRLLDLDVMDPETEIRSVIGCVLTDCIGPAIRDLRGALVETAGDALPGDNAL